MDLQGKVFVIKNKIYTDIPQTGLGLVFWSGVTELLSTSSFRGNSQAPPVCLLSTWAKKVMCLWLSIKTNSTLVLFQGFERLTGVWLWLSNTSCSCRPRWPGRSSGTGRTQTSASGSEAQNVSARLKAADEKCSEKWVSSRVLLSFLVCINLIQKVKWYLVLYSSRPNYKAIQNIARHRRRVQVYKPES